MTKSTTRQTADGEFDSGIDVTGTVVADVVKSDLGSGGVTLSGHSSPDLGFLGYNYTNDSGTEAVAQASRSSHRIKFGNGGTNATTFDYRAPNAAAGTWSERMRIDSAGRVTMPHQPAFNARGTVGQALTAGWDKVEYTVNVYNRGGANFASSRFTAPVSGVYHFSASISESASVDYDGTFTFSYNGLTSSHKGCVSMPGDGGNFDGRSLSSTFYMASGDYVEVMRYASVATSTRGSVWDGTFSGHLIG